MSRDITMVTRKNKQRQTNTLYDHVFVAPFVFVASDITRVYSMSIPKPQRFLSICI